MGVADRTDAVCKSVLGFVAHLIGMLACGGVPLVCFVISPIFREGMPCCLYRFPLGIAAAGAFAFLIAVSRAGCLFERRPFAPAVTRCGNDSGGFVCNLFFSSASEKYLPHAEQVQYSELPPSVQVAATAATRCI